MFHQNQHTIEASIRIRRPLAEVFSFYRDLRNLPLFLGDVMRVDQLGPTSTKWTIQGPLGVRIRWIVEVTEVRENELIRYHTSGASWEIRFTPTGDPETTEVRERMTTPLGRFGQAMLAFIGKPPAKEIAANLNRLRQYLETGTVTDTSYAVKGKFSGQDLPGNT